MKLYPIHVLLFILLPNFMNGQATGLVEYKYLGVSFTIPEGWIGQETEESYVIASNTIPGAIVMIPHEKKYTIEELKIFAKEGINEEGGTKLSLSGQLENIGSEAIGGEFAGTLEWTPANAYIIGKINPYGQGVTIIAATSRDQYDEKYKKFAQQLAHSITYSKAEISPAVKQFKAELNGKELKYMNTYGDAGSGGSDIVQIQLCLTGSFYYYSSSSISSYDQSQHIDNGVVVEDTYSGYASSGPNNKEGLWKIIGDSNGNAMLQLSCSDGTVLEYNLTVDPKKKLHLNNQRFFKAGNAQCN